MSYTTTNVSNSTGNPSEIPVADLLLNLPDGVSLADFLAKFSAPTLTISLEEPLAGAPADALTGGIQTTLFTTISTTTTTISTTTAASSCPIPSFSASGSYTVHSSTRPLFSTPSFPSLSTPVPISVPSPSALPPFFDGDVSLWFCTLEACFLPTEDAQTRFRSVITKLPPSILAKVRHVFPIALNALDPYSILKEEVLKVTSPSSSQRIKELLSKQSLGDRKPSEFLLHLQNLLGPSHAQLEESFTRPLFLEQMPSSVRAILSAFPSLSLSDTAAAADRILLELPPSHISVVSSHRPSPPSPITIPQSGSLSSPSVAPNVLFGARITAIEGRLQSLETEVRNLSVQFSTFLASQRSFSVRSPSPSSSSRSRERSSSRDRPFTHTAQGVCFYHHQFKERALKCNKPCSYSPSSVSSTQQGN